MSNAKPQGFDPSQLRNATAETQQKTPENQSVPQQENAGAPDENCATGSAVGDLALRADRSAKTLAKVDAQVSSTYMAQASRAGRDLAVKTEFARTAAFLDEAVNARVESALKVTGLISQIETASEQELLETIGDIDSLQETDITESLGKLQALASQNTSNNSSGFTLSLSI